MPSFVVLLITDLPVNHFDNSLQKFVFGLKGDFSFEGIYKLLRVLNIGQKVCEFHVLELVRLLEQLLSILQGILDHVGCFINLFAGV